MADDLSKYGLDLHCTMILEDYREKYALMERLKDVVLDRLRSALDKKKIIVTAIEGRVKTEESLAGKLELKGGKYSSLNDLTDIVGVRVITFYSDDVDKIAALAENVFEIDWENSVDKRKMHSLESFGYMSLHYICRIPKTLFYDPDCPEINEIRFELQMRSALQHVWANLNHDSGYKNDVEIPVEHLRNLNRLAGMLELADDEFCRTRKAIIDYRRQVTSLVSDGKFSEAPLNGDTFKSYLNIHPFDALNNKIAAINQAEIHPSSTLPYLEVFKSFGFKTLGDIEQLKADYGDAAFRLSAFQIGGTDIDIISSTLAVQNLCIVYIIAQGYGINGLVRFFDAISGESEYNRTRAERIMSQTKEIRLY